MPLARPTPASRLTELRRLLALLILLVLFFSGPATCPPLSAQPEPEELKKDIVVLVDVSGSVKLKYSEEARRIVQELVLAAYVPANHPGWVATRPQDERIAAIVEGKYAAMPLTGKGFSLLLMPFGDRATSKKWNPVVKIQTFPGDFINVMEQGFPKEFKEKNTFYHLACATAADRMEKGETSYSYYLFVLSDAEDDPGKGNVYDEGERALLARWEAKNVADVTPVLQVRPVASDAKGYRVSLLAVQLRPPPPLRVDPPPPRTKPEPPPPVVEKQPLVLAAPLDKSAEASSAFAVNNPELEISWTMKPEPKSGYTVELRDLKGAILKSADVRAGSRITLSELREGVDIPAALCAVRVATSDGDEALAYLAIPSVQPRETKLGNADTPLRKKEKDSLSWEVFPKDRKYRYEVRFEPVKGGDAVTESVAGAPTMYVPKLKSGVYKVRIRAYDDKGNEPVAVSGEFFVEAPGGLFGW